MREEDKTKLKALLKLYSNNYAVKTVNGIPLQELILTLEKVQEYFFNLEHDILLSDRFTLQDVFQKSRKIKLKGISMSLLQIINSLKNVNDYNSLYKSLTYLKDNDTDDYKKQKSEIVDYLIDSACLSDLLKSSLLELTNE